MAIPTQDGCNPDDPSEFALWAFVDLFPPGAPLLIHDAYLREASKKLWLRGFRHHPDLQEQWTATKPRHWLAAQLDGIDDEAKQATETARVTTAPTPPKPQKGKR